MGQVDVQLDAKSFEFASTTIRCLYYIRGFRESPHDSTKSSDNQLVTGQVQLHVSIIAGSCRSPNAQRKLDHLILAL